MTKRTCKCIFVLLTSKDDAHSAIGKDKHLIGLPIEINSLNLTVVTKNLGNLKR